MKLDIPVLALIGFVLACSSDNSSTSPDDTEDTTTMRVERFDVAPGDTRNYAAGTTIIASSGASIEGEIVIDGSESGDFNVVCESGTLSISGTIRVAAGSAAAGASPAGSRARFVVRAGASSPGAAARKGTSVGLETGPAGHLKLIGAKFEVGDGEDGLHTTVESGAGLSEGDDGGDAGDIIFLTHGGTIEFVTGPLITSCVFDLGTGGRGGDLSVDRDAFATGSGDRVELVAGRGGDSGRLTMEAATIVNRPEVGGDETVFGGIGGRGGNAWWDNSETPVHAGSGETLLETELVLAGIVVRAGRGGDGAVQGGDGGHAAYWGAGLRTDRPDPVPDVEVYGGRGGDVFGSPVPVELAQGGSGGGYVAHGMRGWNGAPHDGTGAVDGADGGSVSARGGDGGDVLAQVRCFSAVGGDGGHTEISRQTIETELPVRADARFDDFQYAVFGGGGGHGGSLCGCPGGDGGSSGVTSVIAGNGGSVFADAVASNGGRGGDVWLVGATIAGSVGGDGDPPGLPGDVLAPTVAPGEGGLGNQAGAAGQEVAEAWTPIDFEDGELCEGDGDTECDEDDPPAGEFGCEGTFFLTVDLYRESDSGASSTREVREITGYSFGNGNWNVSEATITTTHIAPDTSWMETVDYTGNDAYSFAEPRCNTAGEVMWPEAGGVDLTTVNEQEENWTTALITLTGCNPALSRAAERSRFYCCGQPGPTVCYQFGAKP